MKQVTLVLPAPRVEGLVDGVIDPEDIPEQGVKITAAFTGQVSGYWVGAHWVGDTPDKSYEFPMRKMLNATPLEVAVPKSIALLSAGSAVGVIYKVSRIEAGLEQTSLLTPLVVSGGSTPEPLPDEDFESYALGDYPTFTTGPFTFEAGLWYVQKIKVAPSQFAPAVQNKALYNAKKTAKPRSQIISTRSSQSHYPK